jgi:hypothetical protein
VVTSTNLSTCDSQLSPAQIPEVGPHLHGYLEKYLAGYLLGYLDGYLVNPSVGEITLEPCLGFRRLHEGPPQFAEQQTLIDL